MTLLDFLKSGHKPTLLSAFVYSDVSFMVWVLLGPLAVHIGRDLKLSAAQQYAMVAIPLLTGALLRIPVGVLVDRYGPLRTGLLCQAAVIVALFVASVGQVGSATGLYLLGAALGIAGTSMAVALPLAAHWYPDEHQGKALGIAGAASSGTVFAALFAPALAEAYGWHNVLALAIIPLFVVLFLYVLLARERPAPAASARPGYARVLAEADLWWFMLFYAVAFGGVLALASLLVLYFHHQYQLAPETAGYFTAVCVFAGAAARPVGGWIADRFGGIKSLQLLFGLTAAGVFLVGLTPPSSLAAMAMLTVAMAALGMASGAVFQLVPLRFRHEVGAATGLIGAAGGLGGFFLAELLGQSQVLSGSYRAGFLVFAGMAVLSVIGVHKVKSRWRTTWGSVAVTRARV
ncbi:MAG: MFS transporter [Candidatus Muproteobacteria bacterium RBG_16_64_10]|uniref:MFS transporter n=1 Tax=Candidatus Muproteobacteria bacterium RBG_16_64_10 TaxID=1817757 RepID=A0A1F6T1A5_9PROT|nr:MAG: MFS transporter [Candidatus Muproteobacteria bacterium RBG_16_64_10]